MIYHPTWHNLRVCLHVCIPTVGQRACVRPAPPEQAVSGPHLLCGVRRRASRHPRPHLGAAQTIPRHALSPQQRQVAGGSLTPPRTEQGNVLFCMK